MTAIQTPAADAPAEEWGALAVSIPGHQWPWWVDRRARGVCLPGYARRHQAPEWAWIEDISTCSMLDECAPDPEDPATAGCLLALLGDRCIVRILPREGLPLEIVIPSGLRPDGRPHRVTGINLGRACIAAAAAIGRWPGGAS